MGFKCWLVFLCLEHILNLELGVYFFYLENLMNFEEFIIKFQNNVLSFGPHQSE